jgi:chromosomal replication initiation ATPase DnaA
MTTTEPTKPMIINTIECKCGSTFQWEHEDDILSRFMKPTLCAECSAANDIEIANFRAREQANKLEEKRQDLIREIADATPPRYQQTDVAHAGFNRGAWEKIKLWKPTSAKPWIGMVGLTGCCKSRMSYLIASNYLLSTFDDGAHPSFAFVTAFDITEAAMRQFSDSPETKREARNFLDMLKWYKLLLIDDLGKGRLTPAPAAELFALLDSRHNHNRPTIWTSNSTPQQIAGTLSEDLGGPLAGRLLECSKIYSLK